MIHDSAGGVAATILPNHSGVGIFHGITVPLPMPQKAAGYAGNRRFISAQIGHRSRLT
jgi:hypothetical protein